MVTGDGAMHHIHRRKRAKEPYPHPEAFKRGVDIAVYVAGVVGPLMTLPQILKIWVDKNAAGVSAVSWSSYFVLSIVWLVYGVLHKEKPIIFTSAIWLVLDAIVVAGTLMYG